MSKPTPHELATASKAYVNAYERLYNKALPQEKVAEMKFNLVRYIELLIVLDRQHQDWLIENAKPKTVGKP